MQKFKNKWHTIQQNLIKNSHFIKTYLICPIDILFIIYLFYLCFSINSWPFLIGISIISLICNKLIIVNHKELEIEEYFFSDKVIYDWVNKKTMVDKIIKTNLCIFIFYFLIILAAKFVSLYDSRLFHSVFFMVVFFCLTLFISKKLRDFITSYIIEYNFTINFTFEKSEYRRRVWTYLRNRSEVLKRIANDEKLFKIKEIKKQNSELVSFSELELVKNEIKKLTTKQLEFILFKDKLPVFNKNNILTKRVLYFVGAIVVFFSQEIKNLILNFIRSLIQSFSIEKIMQLINNDINTILDDLFLSVIILFLYILIPIFWLLKKIIIFFLNYRQTTIDDYLINMLEEELKNRKTKISIKHNFKNKNRNLQ